MNRFAIMRVVLWAAVATQARAADWAPVGGHLVTRWAADVDPKQPLAEYPRPQLVRAEWTNLNGLWSFATAPKDSPVPTQFADRILVPFAPESAVSGLARTIVPTERAWYRRSFASPTLQSGERELLHFGAVNWAAEVTINGKPVGTHTGGYDAFTFDITDALIPGPTQSIDVGVWNPVDTGSQPRGKQTLEPRGIWYTAVTGIWQTVWLETVPAVSIDDLTLTTDVAAGELRVTVSPRGDTAGVTVDAAASAGGTVVGNASGPIGTPLTIKLADVRPWSPASPFLYDLTVTLRKGDTAIDHVGSYFGLRRINVKRDSAGTLRPTLNGKPVFLFGPLDQGYWPDGLYTAPTDAALKSDITAMKQFGFNMVRKHVKVEPARWYYWCDTLGLMVLQDMPSGMTLNGQGVRPGEPDVVFAPEAADQFKTELHALISAHYNSPAVIAWVPFNEGWGQHDTAAITQYVRQLDSTRLIDQVSGWADRGGGDVRDLHHYPDPAMPALEPGRISFLGEFGGLGLPLTGHTWTDQKNWGYRTLNDPAAVTDQFEKYVDRLRELKQRGLTGAVYTQLTDVEREVNGLMTYDRAVMKVDPKRASAKIRRLVDSTDAADIQR